MKSTFRFALMLTCVFILVIVCSDLSQGGVDSRLVGTWKLDGINWDLYWVVRADGHYRIHGQDPKVMHRGRFEATSDRWSLSSPQWEDGGAYELPDADTWKATGKLGPGVWKRVWYPDQPQNSIASIGGDCGLLTPEEVSIVLDAPVKDGTAFAIKSGVATEGCKFGSQFSSFDRVDIRINRIKTDASIGAISNSFNRKRNGADSPVDVPGLADTAYASLSGNRLLKLDILEKETRDESSKAFTGARFEITLYLKPKATMDDLPKLTELAHLMYSRYSGISPLPIPDRSNSGSSDSGNSGSDNLGSGNQGSGKKGLFGKVEEEIKGVITSNKGGVSGQKSAIRQSWRSFLSGNTPSLPVTGPCLVSEAEIEQHLGFTVTKTVVTTDDGKGEMQQSTCHFVNMQGHGKVRITFFLRTIGSVKRGWDIHSKSQGWTHVKGIGDDAYLHYGGNNLRKLEVGALLGNSTLDIYWEAFARSPMAPKPADTDKLIGLLKLAISRLN